MRIVALWGASKVYHTMLYVIAPELKTKIYIKHFLRNKPVLLAMWNVYIDLYYLHRLEYRSLKIRAYMALKPLGVYNNKKTNGRIM